MSTLPPPEGPRRLILLGSARTYRNDLFLAAAARLGLEVVLGEDVPAPFLHRSPAALPLDYRDLPRATAAIVEYARRHPVQAVLGVDDSGTLLAARASAELGLPHNAPEAAEAARDKHAMRCRFAAHGVPSPRFRRVSTGDDPERLAAETWFPDTGRVSCGAPTTGRGPGPSTNAPGYPDTGRVSCGAPTTGRGPGPSANAPGYPCVIKPTSLSGSRGVMRADTPAEFVQRFLRLRSLLAGERCDDVLIEEYVPGVEVALEGLLDHGRLRVLALFDKPDPLEGPFFEETIYVTPSRLPAEAQQALGAAAERAAAALGLREGPVHAELRWNAGGAWLVEVAGRSIGGLCSKTLRFGTDASLEELILRQAAGLDLAAPEREARAGGVMMIPIPRAGLFRGVEGVDAARAVPLVESVEISARMNYPIVPLPEGDSYLGFIFARGETPAAVEAALRAAHAHLRFDIAPQLTVAAR